MRSLPKDALLWTAFRNRPIENAASEKPSVYKGRCSRWQFSRIGGNAAGVARHWGWAICKNEFAMSWVKKLTLAALLLCLPHGMAATASSEDSAHWVRDLKNDCAIFDASLRDGDTIVWSGDCRDGLGDGAGTVRFLRAGIEIEAFTGTFAKGVAQDGDVTVHWGNGWTYAGGMAHGEFDGQGTLTNSSQDMFQGAWKDGKLNGHGTFRRADGETYTGDWKDDLPDGHGVLTRADGSKAEGEFLAGKLDKPMAAPTSLPATDGAVIAAVSPARGDASAATAPPGLDGLAAQSRAAVDGSLLSFKVLEGGMERDISAPTGDTEKTTFTFINDKLGTVATNGGFGPANAAGLFRVTEEGLEISYGDGRNETVSLAGDGVTIRQTALNEPASCRSFYPQGHVFSDAEKKAAVAAYASRLGLGGPPTATSCAASGPQTAAAHPPHALRAAEALPAAKKTALLAKPGEMLAAPQLVAVKDSRVHLIDVAPVPVATASATAGVPGDAGHCLHVDSDGLHWGMRNACDFDIQFAYCLAHGGNSLTGCGGGGVAGSVAANSFGALLADTSLKQSGADFDFRWLACKGGAGEVAAHLDRTDPPAGRCERATDIKLAKGDSK